MKNQAEVFAQGVLDTMIGQHRKAAVSLVGMCGILRFSQRDLKSLTVALGNVSNLLTTSNKSFVMCILGR